MKLMRKDKVMVITGRDKGKKGEVVKVLPKTNQVVVEGINVATQHVKPSAKDPKGGIVKVTKPINASKVMIIDPKTGRVARVGYKISGKGKKERIFKVSKFTNPKSSKKTPVKNKTEVKK